MLFCLVYHKTERVQDMYSFWLISAKNVEIMRAKVVNILSEKCIESERRV